MDYLTAQETGIKWKISKRRVLYLCDQNRIGGAYRIGNLWVIPNTAEKPTDFRKTKKSRPA